MHTQRKDMPKGDILIAILNTKNPNFNKETPLLSQTKMQFPTNYVQFLFQ